MIPAEIATLEFVDRDSGEKAVAIVRACGTDVALCLSLETDGDVEVVFTVDTAQKLRNALDDAITISRKTR